MSKVKRTVVGTSLTLDERDKLKDVAKQRGMTMCGLIRKAIMDCINKTETGIPEDKDVGNILVLLIDGHTFVSGDGALYMSMDYSCDDNACICLTTADGEYTKVDTRFLWALVASNNWKPYRNGE